MSVQIKGDGDSDVMYRLLVQSVTDCAIFMLSVSGTVTHWNAGAQRIKGYDADEIVGRHFDCFYTEADRRAGLPEKGLSVARSEGRFESEGWRLRKDGTRFWADAAIHAVHDETGTLIGFAKITRDRTERRRTELTLSATRAKLDLALSNMVNGLCLIDESQRLVLSNERFSEMLHLPPQDGIQGRSLSSVISAALGRAQASAYVEHHLGAGLLHDPAPYEFRLHGRILSVTTRAIASGGWVSTFSDITEHRHSENRIRHLAEHDALTNLANRATFHAHLGHVLGNTKVARAVFCVDIDRFKLVNDTLGPCAGDRLLQAVAGRLREMFRGNDLVGRVGGDEFAIVLSTAKPAHLGVIADRLVTRLREPFLLDGTTVNITCSVGIAVAGPGVATVETLLRNADLALDKAKQDGRDRSCFYDESLGALAAVRLDLERRLRRALERREFALHYQPVIRAKTGETVGFEALLRWRGPDGQMVPPAAFIPLAEEAGLMPEIGAWVLEEACRNAASWPQPLTISVNVSPMQLRSAHLLTTIAAALERSGLPAHRLEIEITETAILENRETALDLLRRIRAMGIQVALDDFGTGYSSLSFVHSFPLTRIKIDRSFVRDLGEDARSTQIVRAILGLARGLGLAVTAEGVETQEQFRILRKERCPDVQGFLLGQPEAVACPFEAPRSLRQFPRPTESCPQAA
ncbi:EAL domain-containing protein [Methylobacterium organophilum]|uniref:putative bifunctional diguanylate cyclase/phosphodiesterase n=1 Tax=Methylobacterium organophilum TaxID=410 RepID=UPI001F147503|nr:EAL domain-containing protein [Methylobacterium organophilum]UMY17547.1 EAL domain-containing protein [Methylobacterium organophilum]